MRPALGALLFLALAACDGGSSSATGASAVDSTAHVPAAIDLSTHDLPLLLTAPELALTGDTAPSILWKEETGRLEITAGEHFGLAITEEPADLPRLKADLERDLLKKNTVITETPDLLIFRSEFPDDPSLVFLHFYRAFSIGGRTFVVQDLDGQRYNQQDIDRMVASLSPKQPV